MRIGIRAGHNYTSVGAMGELKEHEEVRKILPFLKSYIEQEGHQALDFTPSNMSSSDDLKHGVNLANTQKVDLYVSIHLNSSNPMGNGTECWIYPSSAAKGRAENVCANLGKNFKNRGVKTSTGLYELKNTTMPAIIVEVCFVSGSDVMIFKNLGYKEIARNIASGILGYNITDNSQNDCTCCYCKSLRK